MHKNLLLFFTAFTFTHCVGQQFTGQWKGEFHDKSSIAWGGDRCDYVLELEVNGTSVSGFSYTYFTDEGKKFYTICRLEGFVNKKEKYLEVREIQRTKTNVPRYIRNCFQIHRLKYNKLGSTEQIKGDWIPVPNQEGDCGYGSTLLTRRSLITNYPNYNAQAKSTPELKKSSAKTGTAAVPKSNAPLAGKGKADQNKSATPSSEKKETAKTEPLLPSASVKNSATVTDRKPNPESAKLEKRISKVIRTIEALNKTVKVDLYDNGEIDGDSVSLFYNGKLLLANKKLSTKPLTLTLQVEDDRQVNELVMYAENLGSIPPNTALMIVTDGNKRYEVRITSDLQKSGTINFVYKPGVAGNP